MRKCPFCLVEIPEEAKVCKNCNATVVKKCTSCNAEILATARKCRYCSADLEAAPAGKNPDLPCGERREIIMTLILMILTCGIWGLVVQYRLGQEINAHRGRNDLSPGRDLALVFLTCGFWIIYIMAAYPQALQDAQKEEGRTGTDLVLPCLLLTLFGFHIVALLILQSEVNKHWELHAPVRS